MDLAKIIEEINAIICPQAKAKEQDFEIRVSPLNYEQVQGDKLRINQILIIGIDHFMPKPFFNLTFPS